MGGVPRRAEGGKLCSLIAMASEWFHKNEARAPFYNAVLAKRNRWSSVKNLTSYEAGDLIEFVNQWQTRSPITVGQLFQALERIGPASEQLEGMTLLAVDFGDRAVSARQPGGLIRDCFAAVMSAGDRQEVTGASKMLHVINPELFVMWDGPIQRGYAVLRDPDDYSFRFLPRMQALAQKAIRQFVVAGLGTAEQALLAMRSRTCTHTLAKVIDEYNYVKDTKRHDELWRAEHRQSRAPSAAGLGDVDGHHERRTADQST